MWLVIRKLEHLWKSCQLSLIFRGFIEHKTHGSGRIVLDFAFPATLYFHYNITTRGDISCSLETEKHL